MAARSAVTVMLPPLLGTYMGAAWFAEKVKYGESAHHLAKVLSELARAGIVESVRGVGGVISVDLKDIADKPLERIAGYNPGCVVRVVDDFVTAHNTAALLGAGFDYVIDAIDAVRVKVAMIAFCRGAGVPVVTCGAAGGQIDPTHIRVDDLSRTVQDPLLAKVRGQLRKVHGFARDPKKKFGVEAVYSTEPLRYPQSGAACDLPQGGPAGLNCAGFGSVVTVTATVGLFAAARAINALSAAR